MSVRQTPPKSIWTSPSPLERPLSPRATHAHWLNDIARSGISLTTYGNIVILIMGYCF